jgi:hypothetical protein
MEAVDNGGGHNDGTMGIEKCDSAFTDSKSFVDRSETRFNTMRRQRSRSLTIISHIVCSDSDH